MNIGGKGGRKVNRKEGRGVTNKHLKKKKRLKLRRVKQWELSM